MNKIKVLIGVSALALMALALPVVASAQYYPNDPYGRNGGNNDPYGRNNGGYYGNSSTVRNLKNRTRDLTRQIDRELDRSRLDGTRREDQINEVAGRFRDAVNDLDNNGRQNDNELRRVHQYANQLDSALRRSRLSYNVQNLWSAIRNDLQYLGGYGYYDNNNRNNRNNRNRQNYPQNYPQNNRRGVPTWWPF